MDRHDVSEGAKYGLDKVGFSGDFFDRLSKLAAMDDSKQQTFLNEVKDSLENYKIPLRMIRDQIDLDIKLHEGNYKLYDQVLALFDAIL